MDLQFDHPTNIHALRPCHTDDATDLVAVGGTHTVEVLSVGASDIRCIASFHIGTRITAIAWSSATVSPQNSDNWSIQLAVATEDYNLHLLSKSSVDPEYIFTFGGGTSGHHGLINDMAFCGGWAEDSSRYVATVSDDKMLMVWDLQPSSTPSHPHLSSAAPSRSPSPMDSPTTSSRPQPTAYVIPFPHPLTSISSHPLTSKEFLVSDCRGSVYLTDWRSDLEAMDEGLGNASLRHGNLVELVEPYAMSAAGMGQQVTPWGGSTAWRSDSVECIGGAFGNRFSIWDLSTLRGGKPAIAAQGTLDGGHKFRWCPTYPEHFAISSRSPTRGAVIQIHNINFVTAQPTAFTLRPRPQMVKDFDFLSLPGIPRLAAAVGRTMLVFPIGEES